MHDELGCLAFAVDVRTNLIDVHGDVAVDDVGQSKQWSLNIGDVEPGIKLNLPGEEMDVFVANDVNRFTCCCSQ